MLIETIFLIIFTAFHASTATEPYYWRTYNGSIPEDAVLTEDENTFVGRVTVRTDAINYYPATIDAEAKTATTAVNGKKWVGKDLHNIMILCTSEPSRLQWKYVHIYAVQGSFLRNIVWGGYYNDVYRYVGKVFHDNKWKISTVYENGHKLAGLNIWSNLNGNGFTVNDFQILMYD
ncbi:uncharacterized protein [Onthophagus taurus]|uniref:uncharacterized protein n=1 Tax=Onthophagus taurus TaxID=166361 RepID=UPI0039BDE9BB